MNKILFALIFTLSAGIIISCTKDSDGGLSSGSHSSSEAGQGGNKNSPGGKSGSTARITVKGNFLYAVDNTSIKVVNISNPADPVFVRNVEIGFGIETIYPFKNYLFIGSNAGMYIYSLYDPAFPKQLSEFEHITSCDPVIANDTLAFVTLRNNEVCNRWIDTKEIQVIDIIDVQNPKLKTIYNTTSYPFGLNMLGNYLFVCHGADGVKIYDIQKILGRNRQAEISSISGLNAYDAIIWQNKLFVIGESGFYQYDYSDINNLKLISSILKNS